MEPFFQWLGHFWWLIFPVMGMAGGAARAWEKSAKRRHQQRLEILRAKGELTAARASARTPTARRVTDAVDAGMGRGGEATAQQLERLFAAQDETTRRWLDYELDVAKLIAFPAMSDGRQPLTAAFLRAQRVATGLRPASSKARLTPEQLAEYRDAVTDYEVAFDVAERDARRVRDTSFSAAERKRLDTAKQLLTVAIDQAATPAERQLAYKRVREELDGLLLLSDDAIDELEKKVALELTTGPTATTAPADSPTADGSPRVPPPTAPPAPPAPVPPTATASSAPPTTTPASASPPTPTPASAARPTTAPGRVVRPKRTP